jgi:hypothetical protein
VRCESRFAVDIGTHHGCVSQRVVVVPYYGISTA